MAISFKRYIDTVSGLAVGTAVQRRELIARFFTTSGLQPTNSIIEFTSAADVSNYYGINTDEYRRALFYFSFVSKTRTRADTIAYARWADADTAPTIIGSDEIGSLAEFQTVTAGAFDLVFGTVTGSITALDLSGATSLADVAATVQTAIRAADTDALFTSATVAYNATASRFDLVGGGTGAAAIAITDGAQTPANLLGWITGARLSNGVASQSVTEVLINSTGASNNFGSFAFVPALTTAQITEAATWNNGYNVEFQYHTQVSPTDATTVAGAIITLSGSGMTLNLPTLPFEYPEVVPMVALAATDYNRQGATISYMYLQANLTPTVTTDEDANLYDSFRINYYGQTQEAGQEYSFYQTGFLTGTGDAPINMNVYGNEQWLKAYIGSRLMKLLLATTVSANTAGRSRALLVVRQGIQQGLSNGTISVGKQLSAVDIVAITEITGDLNAFYQVQTSGYWIDAQIIKDTSTTPIRYIAQYTLVYSKDDVIRKVEGSHTLV